MKKREKLVMANWRITGMEVWDADYFDSEAPACLTIHKDLTSTRGKYRHPLRKNIK